MKIKKIIQISFCFLVLPFFVSCSGNSSDNGVKITNPFDNSIQISKNNAAGYFSMSTANYRQNGDYLYIDVTFSLSQPNSYHVTEKCTFTVDVSFYFKYLVGDSYTKIVSQDICIDVGGTTRTETVSAYVNNGNFVVEAKAETSCTHASGKIKPN